MVDVAPRFWSEEEREALLRVVYEIYNSDYAFTPHEVRDFNEKLGALGVDMDRVRDLALPEAMQILHRDKFKRELIYIIMAEAIFCDDDYDSVEREFMEKLIEKYDLPRQSVYEKISQIQAEKLDAVLTQWLREMEREAS